MDLTRYANSAEELYREFQEFLEFLRERCPEIMKTPDFKLRQLDFEMFLRFHHQVVVCGEDDPRSVAIRNLTEIVNHVRKKDSYGVLLGEFDQAQLDLQQSSVNQAVLTLILANEFVEKKP